jgi:rhodanese-related sulfurtransferase
MRQRLRVLALLASVQMVPLCAGELVGVVPDELQRLQRVGVPVIDIRTPEEWNQTGVIPGSHTVTFFNAYGGYDAEAWLQKLRRFAPNSMQPVLLVCRSGNRSSIVGRRLAGEWGYHRVYHLEKGLQSWIADGHELVPMGPCKSC